MNNSYKELYHHGIKDQKWGKRNGPPYPLASSPQVQKRRKQKALYKSKYKSYDADENRRQRETMSDWDLTKQNKRMDAEKKYRDLYKDLNPPKEHKVRKFIAEVLRDSGKKVATDVSKYAMGKVINKIIGDEVVKVGNTNNYKSKNNYKPKTKNK